MGYLAGPSPNNWGILSDGTHISSLLDAGSGKKEDRRSHPLFGHVALLVMQEVHYVYLHMFLLLLYSAYNSALQHFISNCSASLDSIWIAFMFTRILFVNATTHLLILPCFSVIRSINHCTTNLDLHIQRWNAHTHTHEHTQGASRRLFAVVREEMRLTYDASFQLLGQNSIQGGWYLVSVTSNPAQVCL